MPPTQSAAVASSDSPRRAEFSLGKWALNALSRRTYSQVLSSADSAGSSTYLSDVWKDAPPTVALLHTLMAVFVLFSPLLFFRLRLFHQLDEEERPNLFKRLLNSRVYIFRLVAYAFRGNAMVAAFRDVSVRNELLPGPLYTIIPSRKNRRGRAPEPFEVPDESEYVVIGSGAAGSVAAAYLAEEGKQVTVLEEGGWYRTGDFTEDVYGAIKTMFRSFGTQAAKGRSVFPVMQGSCVGGSTVINGAISHGIPENVYEGWAKDPAIARELPLKEIERHTEILARELRLSANIKLGGLPSSEAIQRLGWNHHAMMRNAADCKGTGRCLQGCPSGGKLSSENSFIPRALSTGATVHSRHRVDKIRFEGRKAVSVQFRDPQGKTREVRAQRGIILAAGVVHTPLLLRRSGLTHEHIGRHFQCHLGVGTLAEMTRRARELEGPPQGIEIDQFSHEGIKLATQLLPPELMFARIPVMGDELTQLFAKADFISSWTASVKAEAEGTISQGRLGNVSIRFDPTLNDLIRVRSGISHLGQLLFEMGATRFFPGISGFDTEIRKRSDLSRIDSASLDARNYFLGVGHLFGTCRLGGDPAASVVGTDFRPHGTEGLFVVDASVFPTNIGVNPQLVIMALARLATARMIA